jgi:hypothetical protein
MLVQQQLGVASSSAAVGQEQWLPLGCMGMLQSSIQWALGRPTVAKGAGMPMGPEYLLCRPGRSFGSPAMGQAEWL